MLQLKKSPQKGGGIPHKTTLSSTLSGTPAVRYLFGFIAGFVAGLVFHQGMLDLLHAMGVHTAGPVFDVSNKTLWSSCGLVFGLLFDGQRLSHGC